MRTPYLVLGALALSCVSAEEADSIEGQTPVAPEVQRPIFEPYPTSGSRAFIEQFTPDWTSRWSASEATKDESFSYGMRFWGQMRFPTSLTRVFLLQWVNGP